MIDVAHDPVPLRNRILQLATLQIKAIEMIPPISFRHPYQLRFIIQIITKLLVGVVDESRAPFLNHCANITSKPIHTKHPQHLMPTLVIDEVK